MWFVSLVRIHSRNQFFLYRQLLIGDRFWFRGGAFIHFPHQWTPSGLDPCRCCACGHSLCGSYVGRSYCVQKAFFPGCPTSFLALTGFLPPFPEFSEPRGKKGFDGDIPFMTEISIKFSSSRYQYQIYISVSSVLSTNINFIVI